MKVRGPFFAACCFAATAFSLTLSGCDSADSRAQQAFTDYQAAAASGDLNAARLALLQAVAAKDDDPTFWEELGKVQLELGSYSDAYYAYTRAYELDRSNVQILGNLTQLALVGGSIEIAEKHAKRLELLAPDHPAAKLIHGYAALKRQDLDEADRNADGLLQTFPFDPGSKLLKARILVARNEHQQAIDLLEEQVRAKPSDAGSLKALLLLHERNGDWPQVAAVAGKLRTLDPKNPEAGFTIVDAAFRSNNPTAAKTASEPLLSPEASPSDVEGVLKVWAERWQGPQAIAQVREFASSAAPHQKLAYAAYFNQVGSPEDAARIVGGSPQMPLTVANLSRNAIIADTIALQGRTDEARQLFDAILAREPDHVYALRGRINLEIRLGRAKAAISDAQRLVSIESRSARDRLLLARAYAAAGDQRQMDRTLWDAFHEIPANRELYNALRVHVFRSRGPEAAQSVDKEFADQRDMQLTREFI